MANPTSIATLVVIGKHLARHGLDFYCPQPLAEKRVIASLDCGRQGWIGLVVELEWCRFSRHGWYDNGGRFVGIVRSPLLELDDRREQPSGAGILACRASATNLGVIGGRRRQLYGRQECPPHLLLLPQEIP